MSSNHSRSALENSELLILRALVDDKWSDTVFNLMDGHKPPILTNAQVGRLVELLWKNIPLFKSASEAVNFLGEEAVTRPYKQLVGDESEWILSKENIATALKMLLVCQQCIASHSSVSADFRSQFTAPVSEEKINDPNTDALLRDWWETKQNREAGKPDADN